MVMMRYTIRVVYSNGEVTETIRHTQEGVRKEIDHILGDHAGIEWNVKRSEYNVGS